MKQRRLPHRTSQLGFTLIEVLVALTIFAVALAALVRAASISTDGAIDIRERLMATWVAQNHLAELVALGAFPEVGSRTGEATQANVQFRWIRPIGDRWTANLIALAYHGIKRFDGFHTELPIATNVLSDRLKFLTTEGIFLAVPYSERPLRFDYHLSEKGLALFPFFVALMQWGDHWCGDGSGPPMLMTHTSCKERLVGEVYCDQCHRPVTAHAVKLQRRHDGKKVENK